MFSFYFFDNFCNIIFLCNNFLNLIFGSNYNNDLWIKIFIVVIIIRAALESSTSQQQWLKLIQIPIKM
jgi:hypothetical protein